jgi:hypothetical protein
MIDIDKYLDDKVKKGYVYFVYSDITKMIYVGETTSLNRIEIYNSISKKKDTKSKLSSYNYYTKHNTINYELAGDLFNSINEFKIYYFETKYHKHLEKSYIKFLIDNNHKLYNTKIYKEHKYDIQEIDIEIISLLPL